MTRRSLILGAIGTGAGLAGTLSQAHGQAGAASRPAPACSWRSAGSNIPFGSAIQAEIALEDATYRQMFLDYCDLVMPMNALKFGLIHPEPGTYLFEPADRMVAFALDHARLSRGTCHVWWNATPDWIAPLSSVEAEKALVDHIQTVTTRYRGKLESWDVVNEVIANDPTTQGPLRRTTWLEKLGARHIPIAFKATAEADPNVRLVINDYDLEFAGPRYDSRRHVMLTIVRQLLDKNVRVDAVGIQGHLYVGRTIDRDAVRAFHRDLKALGVDLLVSELDVIDWNSPPDDKARDEVAYGMVCDLLEAVSTVAPPLAVIAWGLTDRYSWINDVLPRPDGVPARPLPLDRNFVAKPWMALLTDRHG